jgi:hypothetical protein
MSRSIALLGASMLAAGLVVGASAHDGKHPEGEGAKQVTILGELVDTACFVSGNGKARGTDHAECARDCMASGIPAGILPEKSKDAGAMLFLLTNPRPLAAHAGKTIRVEGKANEKMHAIDVKKLFVKQGQTWQEVQLKDEHHGAGGGGQGDGHKDHDHKDHK